LKFLFTSLFLFLIPGSVVAFLHGVQYLTDVNTLWIPLAAGAGTGIVLYFLVIKRFTLLNTFEHELSHAFMALIFLRRITSFKATSRKGGLIKYKGSFGGAFGDMMITLAPYYFPTFTIICVLFRPLIPDRYLIWYYIFIGFTLAYHLLNNLKETMENWSGRSFRDVEGRAMKTDIKQAGYLTSFIIIIGLTLFIYGLILYLLRFGYSGVYPFVKLVTVISFSFYYKWLVRLYYWLVALIRHHAM
jgi:hypothetical protein